MTAHRLPAAARPGCVRLRVADVTRSLRFYCDLLGFDAETTDDVARVRARGGEAALLELHARPGTQPRPRNALGLYHVALLYPERADFARTLLHLIEARLPFQGFADHGVSEAAYLEDPDGNGLELYWDRPPDVWPRTHGSIALQTRVLNVNALLRSVDGVPWRGAPAALRIGHVHLHVSDLDEAERFYTGVIGFDLVTRMPGAIFLAAGDYHHHLGANVWGRSDTPPDDLAGMLSFELCVGAAAAVRGVAERAQQAGLTAPTADGILTLQDPDGNTVRILP